MIIVFFFFFVLINDWEFNPYFEYGVVLTLVISIYYLNESMKCRELIIGLKQRKRKKENDLNQTFHYYRVTPYWKWHERYENKTFF